MQGPVLEPFAYDEADPYASGQHRGIDIGAAAAGDTVVAPAGGTVSFAGTVPTSGESVTIETADGYSVTLTHLGSMLVSEGATVAEGDGVGTVGPSGTPEVDGPYVHLGIRVTADSYGYLDPLGLLPPVVVQTPPAEGGSGSSASQPGAGSATPTTPPATQAAPPAPAASTPSVSTQSATVVPSRSRVRSKRRGRASSSRPEAEPARSSERPAVDARESGADVPGHATKPQRNVNEPGSSTEGPGVEAASQGGHEPTGLRAGHELSTSSPAADVGERTSPPRPRTSPALVPLICNGIAALVAVAAAFAAAWGRRRRPACTSPIAGAHVLQLPRPAREPRRERRAA